MVVCIGVIMVVCLLTLPSLLPTQCSMFVFQSDTQPVPGDCMQQVCRALPRHLDFKEGTHQV